MLAVYAVLSFAVPAHSETEQGLSVNVYTYDPQSTPEKQSYTPCMDTVETTWTSVSQINHDWAEGIVAGCQEDFVIIHYYGYITLPTSGEVIFQSFADDGFYMEIGGKTVINDWWLKGCYGSSGTHQFEANVSQYIDIWWYEYGGGACNILYMYDETGINIVPENAFTRTAIVVEPTPEPTPTPTPDPTVEPTPEPTVEPTPEPTTEPKPEPKPPIVEEPAKPKPEPEPVVEPVVEPPAAPEPVKPTIEDIVAQQIALAEEDDIEISEELAAIPVLGSVAVALADAINYVSNVGSDLTPEERERSEKVIVSAVIVGQISQLATAAAAGTGRSK
jgi:hypothetical protein